MHKLLSRQNKTTDINSFHRVLVRFASSQMIATALRLISGLLVVRLIEPEIYGEFTGVGVYLGFLLVGQGGIINGLSRELPYELGRKNFKFGTEITSSAFVFTIIISVLASLIFLFFGIRELLLTNYKISLIYMTYVILASLNLLNVQFLPTLYRTNNDFDSLSRQKIYVGVCNLLSVILIWFYSLYGLLIRAMLLATIEFFLLYNKRPIIFYFKYNFKHIKYLFKTGLPIYVVGMINLLWNTIVKSLIFNIGGALSYGYFALSLIVENVFGIIPISLAKVIYPKMSIMLGQGEPISKIIKFSIKPLFFQFLLMLFLAIIGVYLLPIIVPIILPNYIDGILAAQWMLFIPVAQSFTSLNSIYNVLKKQKWYLISLLFGAFIGSLFMIIKLNYGGFRLEIFPQGLVIGTIFQQMLSILFIYRKILNDEK